MGTLGVGIMNLTVFSPSSKSNSKIDGNQIAFEAKDFQVKTTQPSSDLYNSRSGDGSDDQKLQILHRIPMI
jgi:hypothetical protein